MSRSNLSTPYAISTIVLASFSIAFWLLELQLLPTTSNYLDLGSYTGGVAILSGMIAGIAAIVLAVAQGVRTHRVTKLTVAALVLAIPALAFNVVVLHALGAITT